MNGVPLLLFFIYSCVTINLLLQCGLGINGAVDSKNTFAVSSLIKILIVFSSVIILWFFFSKIVFNLISGIFVYILLFPVSSIFYDGFEYLVFRYIYKKETEDTGFVHFPNGITAVALFLCVVLANSFLETFILSFGFTTGILIINLIIREVRKRATLEAVPVFLRGKPLVLITMGMLSLVFTTASLLLFRMIG
ncbi:MAG: hypothetical protein LBC80_00625 [Treponema sp.]|jgi:electron transport complex protein RnfA|nr:hypothetical protein [Treponema sp.]